MIDLILAVEKVTESVTGPLALHFHFFLSPKLSSVGQAQQNNLSPQLAHPHTNEEWVQQGAPIPPIASQQALYLYTLGQLSPVANNPTTANITCPREQFPCGIGGTINHN